MTLTEAAFWTKKIGVVALILFAFFIILLLIILKPQSNVLPPKYLEPNFACTQTPNEFLENILTIPSLELLNEGEVEFAIQTDSGKLDDLPEVVNVYRYTNLEQSITSQTDAKALASKLGFEPERIRRSTSEYLWSDNEKQRDLTVNARDLNFTYKTRINKIRELRKTSDLPTESDAISLATNALRALGILNDEYTFVKPSVYLIDINPDDTYSQADSLLNAELIRVDFHRWVPLISIPSNVQNSERITSYLTKRGLTYEIGEMTVDDTTIEVYNFSTLMTYQNPAKSNISVYVGPEDKSLLTFGYIHQIEYKTWDIEIESCGTYPLLNPNVAQQRIQNGEGSLSLLNYNNDEVSQYTPQSVKKYFITDLYITYYEGLFEQKFLQPVYLFSGVAELENSSSVEFYIYYPAIDYNNLQEKKDLPEAPTSKPSQGGFLPS
jgi:hypothetical protein